MNNSRKKSPFLFFLFALTLVLIITFISKIRQQKKSFLIPIPGEKVRTLYTIDNLLVAVTSTDKLFVWNWDDIKNPPIEKNLHTDIALLVPPDNIFQVPRERADTIIIRSLKNDTEINRINFAENRSVKMIQQSPNGRYVAVLTVMKNNSSYQSSDNYRLELLDTNSLAISTVTDIKSDDNSLTIRSLAISRDGNLIAICGQKENGWLSVIDVIQKKIIAEKQFENSAYIREVIFSPEGQTLYAGWIERCLYAFDPLTLNTKDKWSMDEKFHPQERRLNISGLDVSADGSFLAAGSEPPGKVWLWKTANNQKPHFIFTGNTFISDIAFSPDCQFIATSGTLAVDKTRVWRIKK